MSAWESFGSTYVEAVTSALPLQRLIGFSSGVACWLAIGNQTHLSVFETIARVPLENLTDFGKPPLKDANIGVLFAGVATIALGWLLARVLLRAAFAVAGWATQLEARAQKALEASGDTSAMGLDDRKKALELIDSALVQTRARLKSLAAWSEVLAGIAVSFGVASWWGNLLDVAVSVASALLLLGLTVATVNVFLRDYYGSSLYRAKLVGKRKPDIDDVR